MLHLCTFGLTDQLWGKERMAFARAFQRDHAEHLHWLPQHVMCLFKTEMEVLSALIFEVVDMMLEPRCCPQ